MCRKVHQKGKTKICICVCLDKGETGMEGRHFSFILLYAFWFLTHVTYYPFKNKTKPGTLCKSHKTSGKGSWFSPLGSESFCLSGDGKGQSWGLFSRSDPLPTKLGVGVGEGQSRIKDASQMWATGRRRHHSEKGTLQRSKEASVHLLNSVPTILQSLSSWGPTWSYNSMHPQAVLLAPDF